MLSGCVAYAPRPIDAAETARAFAVDRLPPPNRPLTEAEALALAVSRSAAVRQAQATYETARAAARAARASPAWTLNLTAEYSRQSDPQHPWLYGGAVDIPVDAGAPRRTRLETADLTVLKARYDVSETLWTVRTALHKALADRSAAEAQLATGETQLDVQRQRVTMIEKRVATGEDARSLALQARSDLATALQSVSAARALKAQADAGLAAALSLPVEAVSGMVILPHDAASPDFEMMAQARLDAATARADVLKAVIDYDLAEQGLRAAVAGQYPALTVSPGYTWERGVTKLPVSLGLALPPLDLNRGAIAEAEARRKEAGRALEAVQAQVFAEADAASAALGSAQEDLDRLAREDIPAAARGLRVAQRGLSAGETDRTDLLAAEAASLAVELVRIEASRQRAVAVADFEAATRDARDPAQTQVLAQVMAALEGPTP